MTENKNIVEEKGWRFSQRSILRCFCHDKRKNQEADYLPGRSEIESSNPEDRLG